MNSDPDWLSRLFGPRFRWKLRRFQDQLSQFQWELRNRSRAFQVRHKMCPRCRTLMERGTRTCPACGYRFSLLEATPLGRHLSSALPAEPSATAIIIGINVIVFVAGLALSGKNIFAPGHGILFAFGATDEVCERMGWVSAAHLVYYGEYWRIITANFLHIGILHIFFNMSWLAYLGPMVERNLGRRKFVCLYFAAGFGGITISLLTRILTGNLETPGLGASAAVCGLIGSTLAYSIVHRHDLQQYAVRREMIRVIVFILLFGLIVPVDNVAHVAGGLFGAAVTLIGGASYPRKKRQRTLWDVGESAAIGLTLAAFVFMILHGS